MVLSTDIWRPDTLIERGWGPFFFIGDGKVRGYTQVLGSIVPVCVWAHGLKRSPSLGSKI